MKLSTKGRYGLRAIIDLARYSEEEPVSISSIAARQDISERYLEQLVALLKKAGLVKSIRGASGGYVLNKKVKRLALKSVLSAKAAEGKLVVIDTIKLDAIKTKDMRNFLNAVEAGKSVVITPEVNEIVVKSARNIPGVVTTTAKILSVYDIVNAKRLVIDKAALAIIEEVFA